MSKAHGSKAPEGTVFDRLKRWLLNNWIVASVVLAVVAAIPAWNAVKVILEIKQELMPKIDLLVTVVDEGIVCGPNLLMPDTDLVQRSILDVGIKNTSDTDVFLKIVRLSPEEVTGGFFAGKLEISETYHIYVDKSLDMVTAAQGYSEKGEAGSDALVRAGRARKEERANPFPTPIWWVKPDPIDVPEILGDKYTVKKQSEERFRLHMGLKRPIDFIIGRIVVEIETDRAGKRKSEPLEIAICEAADATPKK